MIEKTEAHYDETVEKLSEALRERVLECIRKGKNISKLNAENHLIQAEVLRLRESLLKVHDNASDSALVFFESAHALEGGDAQTQEA